MIDFVADIPIFLGAFGEQITFASSSQIFTTTGIFSVNDSPIYPMDDGKSRHEYSITAASSEVVGVTPIFTATVGNVEYRILGCLANPVSGFTEILLGRPK